jgi:hypothetical protein
MSGSFLRVLGLLLFLAGAASVGYFLGMFDPSVGYAHALGSGRVVNLHRLEIQRTGWQLGAVGLIGGFIMVAIGENMRKKEREKETASSAG